MTNSQTQNDFLPDGYSSPKGNSNYCKFERGENRFRILSRPIIGWEDWQDKKPIRTKTKPEKSIDPQKPAKHFWGMIIWNYLKEDIQILEITQRSIQSAIEALVKDKDWGSPFLFDIKVIKEGDGMDTEYTINPVPHKPVAAEVLEAYRNKPCFLEALYNGEDPWDMTKSGNQRSPLNDLML